MKSPLSRFIYVAFAGCWSILLSGLKFVFSNGLIKLVFQLAMLFISTIAATVQTYYKVNYWRKEKVAGDRESIKELVMGIVFDTYWPILGVYPSIVVWFDYKG